MQVVYIYMVLQMDRPRFSPAKLRLCVRYTFSHLPVDTFGLDRYLVLFVLSRFMV